MRMLAVSLIDPLLLALSCVKAENQNLNYGSAVTLRFMRNGFLKCFLFCVLLCCALTSCTEDEGDIYTEVLSPYAGDSYLISDVRWLPLRDGLPERVDVIGDGDLTTDLLRGLNPYGKASFSYQSGDTMGSWTIECPFFDFYLDEESDTGLTSAQKSNHSMELKMWINPDMSVGCEHFGRIRGNKKRIGLWTLADGDIVEFDLEHLVLEIRHYLVYDYETEQAYDGAARFVFTRKKNA